jgi:two-component system, OmpR family, phosphate regulon response regulator PhoB
MEGTVRVSSDNRPRVLVVDDDSALQRLVATLLKRANMQALSATNAAEAMDHLQQDPLPDIVILDMMLPDVSGMDFLRQMRRQSQLAKLPVIILSALADPDKIREGLDAGANRYLTKPYLANNLVTTIHELLRASRG